MESTATRLGNKISVNYMKILKRFAASVLAAGLLTAGMATQAAGQEGMDIKIRAENRSTDDTTTFCNLGPGLQGDRLNVDVSTASDGSAVGTARFEDANGNVTLMDIDRVVVFFGGLLLEDTTTNNVVPIWFGNTETGPGNLAPAHINVEIPRGCLNTQSTFTVGQDKVTLQIKTN